MSRLLKVPTESRANICTYFAVIVTFAPRHSLWFRKLLANDSVEQSEEQTDSMLCKKNHTQKAIENTSVEIK